MENNSDRLPKDAYDRIFREKVLADPNFTSATPQEFPRAIILGGQPGAGKGGLARRALDEFGGNATSPRFQ
ncbi:zeta toxin family protein [Xanthomonas chitinilytica]|uniref:zeta toxin family protein n=1 Tax=Xanthomonas chitinilytica TaxID=2989819 RepID=UPI003CCDB472